MFINNNQHLRLRILGTVVAPPSSSNMKAFNVDCTCQTWCSWCLHHSTCPKSLTIALYWQGAWDLCHHLAPTDHIWISEVLFCFLSQPPLCPSSCPHLFPLYSPPYFGIGFRDHSKCSKRYLLFLLLSSLIIKSTYLGYCAIWAIGSRKYHDFVVHHQIFKILRRFSDLVSKLIINLRMVCWQVRTAGCALRWSRRYTCWWRLRLKDSHDLKAIYV